MYSILAILEEQSRNDAAQHNDIPLQKNMSTFDITSVATKISSSSCIPNDRCPFLSMQRTTDTDLPAVSGKSSV